MATKKKATKTKKKNGKKPVSVKRNGKVLYGAVAQNILKKRAAKKRAKAAKTNPVAKKKAAKKNVSKKRATKRNAESYSAAQPIKVTQYYRSGGPGYATARERIIRQGQRDMFAPDASMDQLLSFLRKNPTVIDAVRKKLGAAKFETASPSLLKKTIREVIAGARGRQSKKKNAGAIRNSDVRKTAKAQQMIATYGNRGFEVQVPAANGRVRVKVFNSLATADANYRAALKYALDVTGRQSRTARQNPEAGAIFEEFTGQQHTHHDEVTAPTGAPRNLDELGDFVEFKWMDADGKRHTVNLEQQGIEAKLAAHQYADGRQELVLVSAPGKPLPYFGDYMPHGDQGYIYEVTYRAQKLHLGDTRPQLYYHKLGEETGQPPILHINKQGELIFKGGEYWIEASGIHN